MSALTIAYPVFPLPDVALLEAWPGVGTLSVHLPVFELGYCGGRIWIVGRACLGPEMRIDVSEPSDHVVTTDKTRACYQKHEASNAEEWVSADSAIARSFDARMAVPCRPSIASPTRTSHSPVSSTKIKGRTKRSFREQVGAIHTHSSRR